MDIEDMDSFYDYADEVSIDSNSAVGFVDADSQIWDPRAYFLNVFNVQIARVLAEWEPLISILECSIDYYVRTSFRWQSEAY
jgi:hypothetical protein